MPIELGPRTRRELDRTRQNWEPAILCRAESAPGGAPLICSAPLLIHLRICNCKFDGPGQVLGSGLAFWNASFMFQDAFIWAARRDAGPRASEEDIRHPRVCELEQSQNGALDERIFCNTLVGFHSSSSSQILKPIIFIFTNSICIRCARRLSSSNARISSSCVRGSCLIEF